MKKYLLRLPLIIYPYIYLLYLIAVLIITGVFNEELSDALVPALTVAVFVVFHLAVLVDTVGGAICINRAGYTAADAAKVNLTVKVSQIPAYLFHFLLGALGCMLSVWGFGMILYAIAVDLIAIVLSGTHALGCVVKMRREHALGTLWTVLAAAGSYIYVVDIIVAGFLLYRGIRFEESRKAYAGTAVQEEGKT